MPRFWWWDLDGIPYFVFNLFKAALYELLLHGKMNTRLEFHPKAQDPEHEDLQGKPILVLWNTRTNESIGEYNLTGTCPPNCP